MTLFRRAAAFSHVFHETADALGAFFVAVHHEEYRRQQGEREGYNVNFGPHDKQ